jgi:hypothetical protein
VRDYYNSLLANGFNPWLDEKNLLTGQDWEHEIKKAIKSADVVIAFLSLKAVNKKGFIQKEIAFAIEVALEQPEGAIFIIPARLDDCDVPLRLSRWHWVDLFEPNGYQKLLEALQHVALRNK